METAQATGSAAHSKISPARSNPVATKRVVIVQKYVPQYRIAFFNCLRDELAEKGIRLDLIYGDSVPDSRKDSVSCPWAQFVPNQNLKFGKFKLIWQPCLHLLAGADLVIAEHAHKLLLNYVLLLRKPFTRQRFAVWGHGLDMQASETSLLNKIKKKTLAFPDWWFAYTAGRKAFLERNGVPEKKITAVQNAIDTITMNKEYHDITEAEIEVIRVRHGVEDGSKVLIYCGALTKEKNLEMLVAAADRLQQQDHRIRLLVIGSGPYGNFVQQAAASRPWMIYAGPKFGREKAAYFRLADLFLLPGATNLAILDAFAFETPMVTVAIDNHNPEYEYLVHDTNSIITQPNLEAYTNAVWDLLQDPDRLRLLSSNCAAMIQKYNVQNMARNFATGIEQALS